MKKIIIYAAIILLAGCENHKPVDLSENRSDTGKSFETVKIERDSLNSVIKLPGELKPFEKVDIYPKMNGFVKEMFVDRGSKVHKGQILMTLEAPEIAQQIQAAQGRLLQSR